MFFLIKTYFSKVNEDLLDEKVTAQPEPAFKLRCCAHNDSIEEKYRKNEQNKTKLVLIVFLKIIKSCA